VLGAYKSGLVEYFINLLNIIATPFIDHLFLNSIIWNAFSRKFGSSFVSA
jgi:hypothetical protein